MSAWRLRAARAALIALGLTAWFSTQALLARRPFPASGIGDAVHTLSAPAHDFLEAHEGCANALLIISSGVIDALGLFLLSWAVFGSSIRPFLGLLIVFLLRQACQALCALPPPPGMIWRYPGFPSLLVTYGTSNDMFFSGHTSIAVYGAIELARTQRKWLAALGIAIAVFEATTVLVLRAHYTMDVFTAVVAALYVGILTEKLAPRVDALIAQSWCRRAI